VAGRLFDRELTLEELGAIHALERLAKRWPPTLKLFSAASRLIVCPNDDRDQPWPLDYELAHIEGIPNDGGDPDWMPEEASDG
jgi:hypothetical protein